MKKVQRMKITKMIKTEEPEPLVQMDEVVLDEMKNKDFADNLEKIWKLNNEE